MSQPLFHKHFNIMVVGQIISLFGNYILRFALSLLVYDLTGSATVFGTIMALAVIPTILMSPFGGILADRVNKRNVMVILDFSTAALVLGWFFLTTQQGFNVGGIAVVLILLALIQSFYSPATQASVPLMQPAENLVRANAVVNLVVSLSGLLGPVLGGLLYGIVGAQPVIVVSGVCFFLSAVLELFLRIPHVKQALVGGIWRTVREDIRVSMRFMTKQEPAIFKMLLLTAGMNACAVALLVVGLPYFVRILLGLSSELYGLLEGLMAAAGLAGGLLAGLLAKKYRLDQMHILLALVGVVMLPMAWAFYRGLAPMTIFVVIAVSVMLVQLIATVFSIFAMSAVQQRTPDQLLGKVMAYLVTFSLCAQPFGQAIYGRVLDWSAGRVEWVILATALVTVLMGLGGKKACRAFAQPLPSAEPAPSAS